MNTLLRENSATCHSVKTWLPTKTQNTFFTTYYLAHQMNSFIISPFFSLEFGE